MQHAKKFILVDQPTYEKRMVRDTLTVAPPPAFQSPSLSTPFSSIGDRRLSEFDGEMRSIPDTYQPDDVKVKLYPNALSKYKFTSERTPTAAVKTSVRDELTEEEILDSVPPTVRHKAKRLLRHVRESPDVSWNDRGELVYKQTIVPNSNIVELMNDVLRLKTSDRAV